MGEENEEEGVCVAEEIKLGMRHRAGRYISTLRGGLSQHQPKLIYKNFNYKLIFIS